MTDTVAAALIGVSGAVMVALASAVTQVFITRGVIRAEREKMTKQLLGEVRARRQEWRRDKLLEAIDDILAASEPEAAPDYGRVVQRIHRAQLLLNRQDTAESRLNDALTDLGLNLQAYMPVKHLEIDEKLPETRALLGAHSAVTESARLVLAKGAT